MTGAADKPVVRRHSGGRADNDEERRQGGGGATALHIGTDHEADEEAFLPGPAVRRGRRSSAPAAALLGLRHLLTRRNMLIIKLGTVILFMLIRGHVSRKDPPQNHSHLHAPPRHAAAQQEKPQQQGRPQVDPDGFQPGVWGRSYKLLQDGIHHLRHTWGRRRVAPGQVSVVGPMPARCARPGESSASPSHFFLGGQHFDHLPPPSMDTLQRRGVVISASGTVPRLAAGAYITAYLIRKVFHSELPIEVYYVGEREIFDPELKAHLLALGNVQVLDLVKVLRDKFGSAVGQAGAEAARAAAAAEAAREASRVDGKEAEGRRPHVEEQTVDADGHLYYLLPSIEQLASYAAKPYAVLASSFQENLLFDAGAVPFNDPETFFSLSDYMELGFMEFRDYVPSSPHKWDWIPEEFCVDTEAVVNYYQGTEGDSSCVLIDKARNWDALLVTAILNGPLQHITYHKLNGDKDTWLMALVYTRGGPLPPLHTVPGFLFVDYEGNDEARKVHGHLQLLKVPLDDDDEEAIMDAKDQRGAPPPNAAGLLIPLYYNNQLCKSVGMVGRALLSISDQK